MAPFANMQQTLSEFRSKVIAKSTKLYKSAQASDAKKHSYSANITTTGAPFEHGPTSRRHAPTKPRSLMFGDLNLFGKQDAKWRKWVTFGIPVDTWAKLILTMNMFEAGLAVLEGITNFIAQPVFNTAFWSVFDATLCVWGFLIGAIAMYGFCILWGPWRVSTLIPRSPLYILTILCCRNPLPPSMSFHSYMPSRSHSSSQLRSFGSLLQ